MKCDNCKFERYSESENGTECYCNIFGEDIPDIFYKDNGCNLKFAEAKKISELLDDLISMSYSHMGLWFSFNGKEPTDAQKKELKQLEHEEHIASKRYENYFNIVKGRRLIPKK